MQPSIASNLPGAASMSAAIRKGKLEISCPISTAPGTSDLAPLPTSSGRSDLNPTTTTAPAKTRTWPRRSTLPSLPQFPLSGDHHGPVKSTSMPSNPSGRASGVVATTHRPRSSLVMEGAARESGLRATIRRMFGSRNRKHSVATVVNHDGKGPENSTNGNADHAHRRPLLKPSPLSESEAIRRGALNSHAPSTFMPNRDHTLNQDAFNLQPTVDGFNRRNSLPTVVLSSGESRKPLLNSSQHSQTSGSRSSSKSPFKLPRSFINSLKRSSRSADALRDMARAQSSWQAQERRLSEEIKYWRNSVILDPVPTFTKSQTDVSTRAEDFQSPATSPSALPVRAPFQDAQSHPQGLGFGHSMINNDDASAEQRITTVEIKLADLECAIVNLQGNDMPQSAMTGKQPRERKPLQLFSQHGLTPALHPGIMPKSSFDSFSTNSSAPEAGRERISEHRSSITTTTTTATFRPGIARQTDPPAASQPIVGTEELARLMTMLDREREARRGLESQIKDLRSQVRHLCFPAVPQPAPAPTPIHLTTPTSNASVDSPSLFSTSRSPTTTTTPTAIPPSRNTNLTSRPPPHHLHHHHRHIRNPSTLNEHSGDDTAETDTDDGFLDAYETPTEFRDFGFSFGLPAPRSPGLVIGAV